MLTNNVAKIVNIAKIMLITKIWMILPFYYELPNLIKLNTINAIVKPSITDKLTK
jgi:hypothetical protein